MNTESTAIGAFIIVLVLAFLAIVFIGNHKEQPETSSGRPAAGETIPEEATPKQVKSPFDNRSLEDLIRVDFPLTDQKISSPLDIEGKARGFWYFEKVFPVMLADSRGSIIARGLATAQADWMTEDFVPFKAKLEFEPDYGKSGTLIIRNNNPSDLINNNREKRIPILFGKEMMTIKIFFGNTDLDPDILLNNVYPAERTIPKTQAVARAALEELLKGPTVQEKASGFFTNINPGVKIQRLSIVDDGIAKVDFNSQLEFQVGGSARVGAIRAQIIQTLKQFPTVKDVVISIDSRTEDILQP
jgi:hypothetical protein